MNYITFIEQKLNTIKYDLNIENKIIVAEEQAFVKIVPEPSNIYVVVKYLSSTLAYDGKIQPIQLMILSEDNSLNLAQAIFNKFTTENNLTSVTLDGDLVKQTYETPVVISNYNAVGYGFKSLLYVSGLLYILENIIDIDKIVYTYDTDKTLEMYISSFNMVYSMTGNTQPISTQKISTTVKSVSTLTCSFVLPMIDKYSDIISEVLKIMNGTSSGNTSFNLSFTLGGQSFAYDQGFKLISASFTTAPNSAPGLQLGFMV